ncbi:hypothetical protein NPIL_221691 [Nephila pilipes]|uniref:Uncharacterized protein n=1 Tax=Nephila pilipes TaxID=299642 RepID=A0A8X6Q8D9_NEPPI|nr:hypothetical protein NPIL_221691 [Nephila pilipes]
MQKDVYTPPLFLQSPIVVTFACRKIDQRSVTKKAIVHDTPPQVDPDFFLRQTSHAEKKRPTLSKQECPKCLLASQPDSQQWKCSTLQRVHTFFVSLSTTVGKE